jgi:hypothetical protein
MTQLIDPLTFDFEVASRDTQKFERYFRTVSRMRRGLPAVRGPAHPGRHAPVLSRGSPKAARVLPGSAHSIPRSRTDCGQTVTTAPYVLCGTGMAKVDGSRTLYAQISNWLMARDFWRYATSIDGGANAVRP